MMPPGSEPEDEKPAILLLSPNTLVPPLLERGPQPSSPTRERVAERWPVIEALAGTGRVPEAITALEDLAGEMRRTTLEEPEAWRSTLNLARGMVYQSIADLADHAGQPQLARGALERCRSWDAELADQIAGLMARKEG
jgi:hypothetical protein